MFYPTINIFSKYLLSTYYGPGTVITDKTAANKTDLISIFMKIKYIQRKLTLNQYTNKHQFTNSAVEMENTRLSRDRTTETTGSDVGTVCRLRLSQQRAVERMFQAVQIL